MIMPTAFTGGGRGMVRDMDLIRDLLLRLESLPGSASGLHSLAPGEGDLALEGYSAAAIRYHCDLLIEAGMIKLLGPMGCSVKYPFDRLTWAGHDFLDAVREPVVWAKTKQGAEAVGGFSIDLLKDLAKGFLRKQIKELTGVQLP